MLLLQRNVYRGIIKPIQVITFITTAQRCGIESVVEQDV